MPSTEDQGMSLVGEQTDLLFCNFFGLTRSVSTMPSTEDQGMSLVGEQTDLLFCNFFWAYAICFHHAIN
jgi:hypothetical protein